MDCPRIMIPEALLSQLTFSSGCFHPHFNMKLGKLLLLTITLLSHVTLFAQQPQVVAEALKPSPIEQNLRKLT
jgi:hypothetical protein